MTEQRLTKRKTARTNRLADLEAENKRLQQELAKADRKAAHGCSDFNCSLCDEDSND